MNGSILAPWRLWLLVCCTVPLACATSSAAGDADVAAIGAIALERGCNGCADGSRLVLRREGSGAVALLVSTGNARMGTEDRRAELPLAVADFEALARLVLAQRFFDLAEAYEEPDLRDGAWATLSVVRGGVEKVVLRRDGAGPEALLRLESAIDALRAKLSFPGP